MKWFIFICLVVVFNTIAQFIFKGIVGESMPIYLAVVIGSMSAPLLFAVANILTKPD